MTTVPILDDTVNSNDVGHLAAHDALADLHNLWSYPDQSGYYKPSDFITGSGIVQPRETSIVTNATWGINADTTDLFTVTAQAVAVTTISNPTGTPAEGQMIMLRVKDNGSNRALTWSGSQWRASSDLALPSTTTGGKTMYLAFIWNADSATWDLLSVLNNF